MADLYFSDDDESEDSCGSPTRHKRPATATTRPSPSRLPSFPAMDVNNFPNIDYKETDSPPILPTTPPPDALPSKVAFTVPSAGSRSSHSEKFKDIPLGGVRDGLNAPPFYSLGQFAQQIFPTTLQRDQGVFAQLGALEFDTNLWSYTLPATNSLFPVETKITFPQNLRLDSKRKLRLETVDSVVRFVPETECTCGSTRKSSSENVACEKCSFVCRGEIAGVNVSSYTAGEVIHALLVKHAISLLLPYESPYFGAPKNSTHEVSSCYSSQRFDINN